MKKLRILFFGGTYFNYQVALKCTSLGATCFFSDANKDCFVSNKDTNFININFNDRNKIIRFIKKKKINFLYTTQSDVGLKSLGYINSKLKLPGTNYTLAKRLTNKAEIRKILTKKKFVQPKFLSSINLMKIKNFIKLKKCFIKPVDSSGSRGVNFINNKKKIKEYISNSLKYSRTKKIIIEEKINGIEFGAQTFSINGKCKYVFLHDDYMSSLNKNIPNGHSMPFFSIKKKLLKLKIENEIKRAIDALKVINGPCNVDCILTNKNEPMILEVSPRMGATCLTEIIRIYSGVDWDINTINLWNGFKIKFPKHKNKIVLAKVFESKYNGIVNSIRIKKKYKNTYNKIFIKKGEFIQKFTDGSKLFGYTLTHGTSLNKMLHKVNKTISSISVKLK